MLDALILPPRPLTLSSWLRFVARLTLLYAAVGIAGGAAAIVAISAYVLVR